MFSTRICVDRLVLPSRCNFAEKLLTSFSSKVEEKLSQNMQLSCAVLVNTKINYPKLRPEWDVKNLGQFRNQTSARISSSIGQKKLLGVLCINHIHTHADSFWSPSRLGAGPVRGWCTSKMKPKKYVGTTSYKSNCMILYDQAMTERCPNSSIIHNAYQIHRESWIFLACCFIASTHAKSAAEMIKPLIICQ